MNPGTAGLVIPAEAAPGTTVRPVNPAQHGLREGAIEAGEDGRWRGTDRAEPREVVRVRWTSWSDGSPREAEPVWVPALVLAFKGECPGCSRAAWYVPYGNPAGEPGGWRHEAGSPRF